MSVKLRVGVPGFSVPHLSGYEPGCVSHGVKRRAHTMGGGLGQKTWGGDILGDQLECGCDTIAMLSKL